MKLEISGYDFETYIKSKEKDIIFIGNDNCYEIVRDIILSNIERGKFNISDFLYDMASHNNRIFEDIAYEGVAYGYFFIGNCDTEADFYDAITQIADDEVKEYFFAYGDELSIIENILYEVIKRYDLYAIADLDECDEYPTFMVRCVGYADIASDINYNSYSKGEILLHTNNAQQTMFADVFDYPELISCGRGNILIMDYGDESKDKNINLIGG